METRPLAPDRDALHQAALNHLARYAATEAGLLRVLERKIARWLRESGAGADEAGPAREAAREVARALAGSGVVDDAAFAEARARRLRRAGRSRRMVAAHLAAKGVDQAVAAEVLARQDDELPAAVAFARRRRIGPFRAGQADEELRRRELGAMARAGFPRSTAELALDMAPDEAQALVTRLKQG